ncbi:unnamed protein product [Ilex paraguariensis]|uniref:Uncharacterized protein n=1 Tax=Ilex paraguariensis TaxID=185542 RepID=A0ABC8RUR9_9AQUA
MDPKLCIAAESNNIDVLVQNKEKLVELTPHHNTVLHITSQQGHTECVSKILSMHLSLLHCVNSSGKSALHLAARNGKKDVVMALIRFAASDDGAGLESGVEAAKEML